MIDAARGAPCASPCPAGASTSRSRSLHGQRMDSRRMLRLVFGMAAFLLLSVAAPKPAPAALIFTTGAPDGRLGSASRPSSPGLLEIESADDFILNTSATIPGA